MLTVRIDRNSFKFRDGHEDVRTSEVSCYSSFQVKMPKTWGKMTLKRFQKKFPQARVKK